MVLVVCRPRRGVNILLIPHPKPVKNTGSATGLHKILLAPRKRKKENTTLSMTGITTGISGSSWHNLAVEETVRGHAALSHADLSHHFILILFTVYCLPYMDEHIVLFSSFLSLIPSKITRLPNSLIWVVFLSILLSTQFGYFLNLILIW